MGVIKIPDEKSYCVYLHRCPNGKVYIGISKNCQSRWNSGLGYKDNKEFFSDIQKFRWDNIEHKILLQCLTESEAKNEEAKLILAYDSENPEKGYNKTSIKRELLKLEQDSKSIEKKKIEKNDKVLEEIKFKLLQRDAFFNGLKWFKLFTENEISQLKNEEAKLILDSTRVRLFRIDNQFKSKLLFQKDILYPGGGVGRPPSVSVYRIGEELFVNELCRDNLICLFEFYSYFSKEGDRNSARKNF